ncbi:hypothetical protein UlMin_016241 [Ulmus minor]
MDKLGFSTGWTKKIMACISSVSYSFQFNGQRFGHLNPSRGLRQGDPLSPYLFLLCGEGLSSILHQYEQLGRLQGLKCGQRGPIISHLLFADDSLLFLEANSTTCTTLKEALNIYEVPREIFGFGLPCFTGKNKQGLFSSIRDRVWNKLSGWKSKLLSAGGREILSKAVIQAIPSYAMNLFKLPVSLIRELHRLCAQFWSKLTLLPPFNFQLYKFSHTHRMGNQVAHSLVRLALSLDNEQIWPMGIPESINHVVYADIQQISSS